MAEMKTKATVLSVDDFINKNENEQTRKDCYTIVDMMEKVSGKPPVMWGTAIIGFDSYHYKYDSGREGEMCLIGFSPRKANLTLYVLSGFEGQDEMLTKLGKHKAEGGCLYIKKLSDVNLDVLNNIIVASLRQKKIIHHVG